MFRHVLPAVAVATLVAPVGGAVSGAGQPPPVVSLAFAPALVSFGEAATARGRVVPADGVTRVVVERRDGLGWRAVVGAVTDERGRFAARIRPARGGVFRARLARVVSRTTPVRLEVVPRVDVISRPGTAFAGAPLTLRVAPATYAGRARVTVWRKGEPVGEASGRLASGLLRLTVPTPAPGRFHADVQLSRSTGFAPTATRARLEARVRTLAVSSAGPDVTALRRRLAALRFHLPPPTGAFDTELSDSVIAFQKASGLPRTGVVDLRTWRALAEAEPPKARYRGAEPHIEVDKSRQILLVVRKGEVHAAIPISSGATGNTPVGSFRILWKAPMTTTWLGPAILYRTLTFHGGFAIHGFTSVPSYPASHGCVRVPIWAADWLYDQSPVGERVYIYE